MPIGTSPFNKKVFRCQEILKGKNDFLKIASSPVYDKAVKRFINKSKMFYAVLSTVPRRRFTSRGAAASKGRRRCGDVVVMAVPSTLEVRVRVTHANISIRTLERERERERAGHRAGQTGRGFFFSFLFFSFLS